MKSNYKKIGEFIELISVKNTDSKFNELLGVSIDKFFMPSVANTVGTDLSRYKIIKKHQFACNLMHIGRDDGIPIALSTSETPFIVSPAYKTFEINEVDILLPEYLMMWFKRSEFDRESTFHTDGDIRGGLPWNDFCDIELPVPSIEKQKEIVAEYKTVTDRIELNEKLNEKLEETAQAVYREWFVDFNFPMTAEQAKDLGDPKLEGKQYRDNGGKMVWNDELEIDVPDGWEVKTIKNFSERMHSGGTPSRSIDVYWDSADYPWLKTGELKNKIIIESEEYISEQGLVNSSAKLIPQNAVLVAMYGQGDTKGQVGFLAIPSTTNQACCAMICKNKKRASYLYYHLRVNRNDLVSNAIGGAQPNLSKELIENFQIIDPTKHVLNSSPFMEIINEREYLMRELSSLLKLKKLLLSKMSKVEL